MRSKLMVLFLFALAIIGASGGLSHRATASSPVPSPFIGTWQTTWDVTYAPDPAKGAPITVKADTGDPNTLDGVIEVKGANGVMFGTLSYDKNVKGWIWTGNWWNPDGVHGGFAFTVLDSNKNRFDGNYTVAGSDKSYKWQGTR